MRLIVNDIPPSLNKVLRMHWAKRRGLLNAWIMMIRVAFGPAKAYADASRPWSIGRKRVGIVLFHSRFFDKDNAYGACKVIFDALKAEKLIVDDSHEWLEAEVVQQKCPHKQRHTIIELEAVNLEKENQQ